MNPRSPAPSGPAARVAALLLCGASVLLAGCVSRLQPPPAYVRSDGGATTLTTDGLNALRAEYDTALGSRDFEAAKLPRNRMIQRIRVDIDSWYATLQEQIYEQRAGANTIMDFVELGLAGAGTIVGGKTDKTVLASILSVGKGTRLSYDKNWFHEKATESLINAMNGGRDAKLADVIRKMELPADKYSFEEGWADMIAYYQAGTIQGGLSKLAADTGQTAAQSAGEVVKANKARYPLVKADLTQVQADEIGNMRALVGKMDAAQMRKTLEQIIGKAPAATELKDLAPLMQEQLDKLFQDIPDADRKKIIDAIKANAPTP